MSLQTHDLHRSIAAMGFGLQNEIAAKARETERSKLAESVQQFQIEVAGEAGGLVAWSDAEIRFAEILHYAPFQRDSNRLTEPHVYFGSVLESGPPVVISAVVTEWVQNTARNFTGAKLKVGVHIPGGTTTVAFAAVLHVTVQGFGEPLDLDHARSGG